MSNIYPTKRPRFIIQCIFVLGIVGIVFFFLFQTRITTFRLQYFFTVEKHQPILPIGHTYTKWIVVTTISEPTKDIEKLASIEGWKLLVVADLKTPPNWTFPGCIFLSVQQQQDLDYDIAEHLPYNSYTRKNIGYLYAIQHGAKYIYDTDDDNHPIDGLASFRQNATTSGLIYGDVDRDFTNPYAHFGQPSIWPRGYPLESIASATNNTYQLSTFRTPAIQQGLVNGDPDVDAIFRLTRKQSNKVTFNITFDHRAPPITLPQGVFAPFNSQNTFIAYEALWSLYLPSSVAFRVTDIWRGYWAQKLLWLLGQRIAFFPPNAVQLRNAHNYLKDFKDEDQFYLQTSSLIQFLKKWQCYDRTFFKCVSRLSHDMAEAQFWKMSDAELIDFWLSDLKQIGYEEPQMEQEYFTEFENESHQTVYFSPNLQKVSPNQGNGLDDLSTYCSSYLNASNMPIPSTHFRFDKILLIIVFNFPYYKNIGMLEALFRDHFPNIVYCGQTGTYENLAQEMKGGPIPLRLSSVSFINITSAYGYFGYECAIRGIEMNYNDINGYLILGDDVLLNYWNLKRLTNFSDVARLEGQSCRTVDRHSGKMSWMWWDSEFGKVPLEKALRELEAIAANDTDPTRQQLVQEYIENRQATRLNMTVISFCLGDFYYVPHSASRMFVQVMKVFLKHKVFLEIAIPTTLVGLHSRPLKTEDELTGVSLWGGDRSSPMKFYNSTFHYLHPIKMSELSKNTNLKKKFCSIYIYDWYKNW